MLDRIKNNRLLKIDGYLSNHVGYNPRSTKVRYGGIFMYHIDRTLD